MVQNMSDFFHLTLEYKFFKQIIKINEYLFNYLITYQGPMNMSVMVSTEVNIEKVIQYINHIPYSKYINYDN